MNATHISEIKIENFRGFQKLELTGLQAVNLIVGHNNVGKTSLLEAIIATSNRETFPQMPSLFRSHSGSDARYFKWLLAKKTNKATITLSTKGVDRLTIAIGSLPRSALGGGYYHTEKIEAYSFGWEADGSLPTEIRVISVHHSTPDALVSSFADAIRSPERQRLLEQLLSKVDSRIRDAVLDFEGQPFIALDMGLGERVPLPQTGQGIYRLVAIFAQLLGQKPQICFIDEIENGLHYTVLKQVWKGIAEVSSMLGIQVFATTHSKECLDAAQEVFFDEDPEKKRDFAVIQLMRVKDQVVGRVLNEARVEEALENDIELR